MFLEMSKDTFSDKRIPYDDMDKVIYGLGALLNSYTWLKDRDPETLHYVANYSLAVHNTCPPSAPMRQIGRVEEGRISGSS
jgi:hypothetical protein